jgi:hypothetical protein
MIGHPDDPAFRASIDRELREAHNPQHFDLVADRELGRRLRKLAPAQPVNG